MANKKDKKENLEKTEFGDIVKNTTLIKRTLMVSAFPALVREYEKNGKTFYDGFLPGFEFSEVEGAVEIGECMEQLQDLLDDNIEELVVFGKQLPNLPEDEELMEQNPGYSVRYLDINVYAEPEEDFCTCGCEDCEHGCDCGDDCDNECDDDCDCGCHDGHECHCHEEGHECHCHDDKENKDCKCGHEHKGENHDCKCKDKNKK